MFGIGSGEIFLVMAIAFLLYGPERLPVLAHKIGRSVRKAKQAADSLKADFDKGMTDEDDGKNTIDHRR